MANPIPTPPTPPVRGVDQEDAYTSKANDMMAYFPVMTSSLNEFIAELNSLVVDTQAAEDAATRAEQAAADAQAVGLTYQEAKFGLGGDFVGTENMTATRVGNMVTLSCIGSTIGHNTAAQAVSASGIVPEAFRTANGASVSKVSSSGNYALIIIRPSGTVEVNHYDSAGNPVSRLSTVIHISYNIQENIA